ncbi:MAG TPA: succinate dehydrogenase cytochrome b subunit [Chitinophagaceae bacterium]
MNWKQFFLSSIGKKLIMSFTGLFLISFLIVHCSINFCIFVPDHGKTFNAVAHFMGTNWIVHILELGLFAGIILHAVQGLLLWSLNRKKRPVKFAVQAKGRGATSTWYSRSMGLLGTLILIFLIIHLSNFWGPNRYSQIARGHELNLFDRMKELFSNGWLVIIYIAGLISLSWHLMHGFQSAFRTLGMSSHRYIPIVKGIGIAFSIIVPVIFALMPVSFYFGIVN